MSRVSMLVALLVVGWTSKASALTTIEGVSDTGALYGIWVPDAWNGSLVVFAHGRVPETEPLKLPASGLAWRDIVLPQGYAFAMSSFSANGMAIKEGTVDTRALTNLFRDMYGEPRYSYIIGHSLGAIIALQLAETESTKFDGVLTSCGAVAGPGDLFDYRFHVRALFDYFYPGALPWPVENPPANWSQALLTQIFIQKVAPKPAGAVTLAGMNVTKIPFTNPNELAESILTPIFSLSFVMSDAMSRAKGVPMDNDDVWYAGSPNDTVLNGKIARESRSRATNNYFRQFYTPTGEVRVPMVSLHTTRDPEVPFAMENIYKQRATDAGYGDNVVLLRSNRYGHCTHQKENPVAFNDLKNWVEGGKKPLARDVTVK